MKVTVDDLKWLLESPEISDTYREIIIKAMKDNSLV